MTSKAQKVLDLISGNEAQNGRTQEAQTTTNKDSVFEVINAVRDYEEIVKELKFQANSAKQDPDRKAQELLDTVEVNLQRMERLTDQLRKKLGLS